MPPSAGKYFPFAIDTEGDAWVRGLTRGSGKEFPLSPPADTHPWPNQPTPADMLCRIGQILNTSQIRTSGCDDLPTWQQETDADIFERIEQDRWHR
jgi:hypothetical protein